MLFLEIIIATKSVCRFKTNYSNVSILEINRQGWELTS